MVQRPSAPRTSAATASLIRTGWPTRIAFREGPLPVMPVGFSLFDQFIRALAMLFLNEGASPATTVVTIPTGNRPGA